MAQRLNLQAELAQIVADVLDISLEEVSQKRKVIGQVPKNITLTYPCIKYSLSRVDMKHANNAAYREKRYYQIILIDKEPEGPLFDRLLKIPHIRLDRNDVVENLYHYYFTLLYIGGN